MLQAITKTPLGLFLNGPFKMLQGRIGLLLRLSLIKTIVLRRIETQLVNLCHDFRLAGDIVWLFSPSLLLFLFFFFLVAL